MLCATILTLAFVSSSNVYSEESYIVDTATDAKTQSVDTQSIDCAMNTADVAKEMGYYWDTDNEKLAAYLKRYNIVSDLEKLDSYNVTQEMLSEDMIP